MNYFWIDPQNNITKSYTELLDNLNSIDTVQKYIFRNEPYEILLQLILALANGQSCHVLDADFSESELKNLGIGTGDLSFTYSGSIACVALSFMLFWFLVLSKSQREQISSPVTLAVTITISLRMSSIYKSEVMALLISDSALIYFS